MKCTFGNHSIIPLKLSPFSSHCAEYCLGTLIVMAVVGHIQHLTSSLKLHLTRRSLEKSFICSKETENEVSITGVRNSILQKYPNNCICRQQKSCLSRSKLTKRCMYVMHIKICNPFHSFSQEHVILSAVCAIRGYFTLVCQNSIGELFHC